MGMQKFNTTQITSILEKDVYIFRIKEISFSLSFDIKLISVICGNHKKISSAFKRKID